MSLYTTVISSSRQWRPSSLAHDDEQRVKKTFEETFIQYNGLLQSARPRIPKLKTTDKTKQTLEYINNILKDKCSEDIQLEELHALVYVGAVATLRMQGQKVANEGKKTEDRKSTHVPPWERRLNQTIQELRKNIGQLTQALSNTASRKVKNKAREIVKKYRDDNNSTIPQIQDLLKQHLAAKAKRLRRYKESAQRRTDNKQFKDNERNFYRRIANEEGQQEVQNNSPRSEVVNEYWSKIWSGRKEHKKTAKWIKEERARMNNKRQMVDYVITTQDVTKAAKKTYNWKAPGKDSIHNYWWKKLDSHSRKAGATVHQNAGE